MIGPLKKIKARWQHLTIRSQVAVIFIKNHKAGTAVKRMWSAESYELLQTVASIEAEKMCIQQRCYWACPIRGNQDWVLKGLRAVTPIKSHGSLPFSGPEPVFGSQTHWLKRKQGFWNERLQCHGQVPSQDFFSSSPKGCTAVYAGTREKESPDIPRAVGHSVRVTIDPSTCGIVLWSLC